MTTKNKNYAFRISEKDLALIRQRAKKAKLTVTDYITKCALDKKIIVIEGVDELSKGLKHIGNNLNQLTMLCNLGKLQTANLSSTKAKLGEIHDSLKAIFEEVNSHGNPHSC